MTHMDKSFAFVIATLNGAGTVANTIRACAAQAPTYLVSDGSTDETVEVALAAGAMRVKSLCRNIGKPSALYRIVHDMGILDRYDFVCIVDDDTIVEPNFVEETMRAFKKDVAVVCAKTKSDWNDSNKWRMTVANRAFGYWKYQLFIRKGQSALGVMNCISGSNSVYRSDFLEEVLLEDTPYVVDDTYFTLETHRINQKAKSELSAWRSEWDRFWDKVDKPDGEEGCWLWTAYLNNSGGYGVFKRDYREHGNRTILAHRWSFETIMGPIPDGSECDHLCKTPACVNPSHIELVDRLTNMERSTIAEGRRKKGGNKLRTHCRQGHPLTEDNVQYEMQKGVRVRRCRICRSASNKSFKERRREVR